MACSLENQQKKLKLNGKEYINILLIGETGVGKSTFINSIINYLYYKDLEQAEKENLLTLIPLSDDVQDIQSQHIIQTGMDQDLSKCLNTNVSVTHSVMSYAFPVWGRQKKICLIDTPGMGDKRGVEQDNINCKNILSYIHQLDELHAICFLFRPTNTRITKFFGYCISQILSQLDKSASKNIIFLITNTRETDYGPGETFPILQQVLKDIEATSPNIKIPFNRNIFCFDNEAFQYLASRKRGVEFDDSIKQRIHESWKNSVKEGWKLINYIMGNAKNPPLEPHFIKTTRAIDEARKTIVLLAQPLAEIRQLIINNLSALQIQETDLNINNNILEELVGAEFFMARSKLSQPVTVCTSKRCIGTLEVDGIQKRCIKQICHNPCYDVSDAEVVGSSDLLYCAALDRITKKCEKCSCDLSVHMHVKTKNNRIIDANLQNKIDRRKQMSENINRLIKEYSERQIELEKEHQSIITCGAKCSHFLHNNASITPFNDFYKEFLDYLIVRQRSLGVLSNTAVVHQLEKLLREYEEAKKTFANGLNLHKELGVSDLYVKPQKIYECVQDLYILKHMGNKIKQLCEIQKKSYSREYEFTEYVFKEFPKQQDAQKAKDKKKRRIFYNRKSRNVRSRSKMQHRESIQSSSPSYHHGPHHEPYVRKRSQSREQTPSPSPSSDQEKRFSRPTSRNVRSRCKSQHRENIQSSSPSYHHGPYHEPNVRRRSQSREQTPFLSPSSDQEKRFSRPISRNVRSRSKSQHRENIQSSSPSYHHGPHREPNVRRRSQSREQTPFLSPSSDQEKRFSRPISRNVRSRSKSQHRENIQFSSPSYHHGPHREPNVRRRSQSREQTPFLSPSSDQEKRFSRPTSRNVRSRSKSQHKENIQSSSPSYHHGPHHEPYVRRRSQSREQTPSPSPSSDQEKRFSRPNSRNVRSRSKSQHRESIQSFSPSYHNGPHHEPNVRRTSQNREQIPSPSPSSDQEKRFSRPNSRNVRSRSKSQHRESIPPSSLRYHHGPHHEPNIRRKSQCREQTPSPSPAPDQEERFTRRKIYKVSTVIYG